MQDLKEGREEAIEASGEGRFAGLKEQPVQRS